MQRAREERSREKILCVCVCVCVLGCTWGEWVGIGNAGEGSRDFPKRLPQERNLIWEWFFYQRRSIAGHGSLPKEVSGGFDIYSLTHFSVIYWLLGMCQELCQIWGFSKENVLVPHYREWTTKREEKIMFFFFLKSTVLILIVSWWCPDSYPHFMGEGLKIYLG